MTIRYIITSRGRSNRVTTHKLIPQATLVAPENDAELFGAKTLPPRYLGGYGSGDSS